MLELHVQACQLMLSYQANDYLQQLRVEVCDEQL